MVTVYLRVDTLWIHVSPDHSWQRLYGRALGVHMDEIVALIYATFSLTAHPFEMSLLFRRCQESN